MNNMTNKYDIDSIESLDFREGVRQRIQMYLGSDEELLYYDTPFYDVIKCNDKFNIVKNKNYTHEELFDYCQTKK